jgi:hypothetical protein
MTQFVFGSGTVIAKRTDVANQKPALIGTLQDVEVDFDRKIESLLGQYRVAVAFGGGELKIGGKAKFAQFQATHLNNLLLGDTLTAASGINMTTGESITVPAPSGPYTVTVANGATFVEDLGVFYADGTGQLTPSGSASAAGIYIPGAAAVGTYTFNASDASKGLIAYYGYTVTTENKIAIGNALMGAVPTFELYIREAFTYFGTPKTFTMKLNACVSSKLSLPFSNEKFAIPEFDFQAGADASNNVGTISMTE